MVSLLNSFVFARGWARRLRAAALVNTFIIGGVFSLSAVNDPSADGLAFFERKIRPLLADNCYQCHSSESEKLKGGLLLDTREGILKGGESGPAILPGDPDQSLCPPQGK